MQIGAKGFIQILKAENLSHLLRASAGCHARTFLAGSHTIKPLDANQSIRV